MPPTITENELTGLAYRDDDDVLKFVASQAVVPANEMRVVEAKPHFYEWCTA